MDKTNRKWVFIGILLLALGFMAGRWTMKTVEKIEYVKGETVHDTIPKPVPYLVEIPADPVLPMKPDTIKIPGKPEYITQVVDTAQIIAEFIKKNSYRETLFDNDTIGTMIVDAQVQYNQLQKLGYTFTPIQKQITLERKKVLSPFISVSANTFGYVGAGGGLYYNNLGFEAKYLTDFQKKGFELGLHIKF